ncbi:MAG: peroxiredoxin-like family protein [Asticcacaulis sp.]
MSQSVNEALAALNAERAATWPAERLKLNRDQRETLVREFSPEKSIKIGVQIGDFVLEDVTGGAIRSQDLTAQGPYVLLLFRFAGCPACNLALPAYDRDLWPQLQARGVPLVAISPQVPERLVAIKDKHQLGLTVATDRDNALSQRLGLTYEFDEPTKRATEGPDWIGAQTGTGTWELPLTSVLIVDKAGVVRFVDVRPDWMKRTEVRDILRALDDI